MTLAVPETLLDAAPSADAPIGDFSVTFYYVVGEDEVAPPAEEAPSQGHPAVRLAHDDTRPAPTAADDPADPSQGLLANVQPVPADPDAAVDPDSDASSLRKSADDRDLDPDQQLVTTAPPEKVTLYDDHTGSCKPVAEVSKAFAVELALQGTGRLRDGRILNIWSLCRCDYSPCFKVSRAKWGTSGTGRALQPFRTVAVDPRVIKLGTLLYIPELEGRLMPGRSPAGGFVHDGCVLADDVGGGIKGAELDLFVGRRGWYHGLAGRGGNHRWAKSVSVFDGSKHCERKGRRIVRRSSAS